MEIAFHHPARLPVEHLGTSVVIDVLRATSTAAVLAARGAPRMFAVETPDDLRRMTDGEEELLVVSELEELASLPNRIDNSPVTARTVDISKRAPILVTTNGTKALAAAARQSDIVLLASFLNLKGVAEHIRATAPKKVTLLPAGKFSDASGRIEDDLCAQMLESVLIGRDPNEREVFERIRADAIVQRRLRREGFAADLDLALTPSLYDVVPFVSGVDASGSVSRCLIQPFRKA